MYRKIIFTCIANLRALRETPCMMVIGPPACDHQWFRLQADNAKNFLVSWLRFPFSAHGSARRCAPKLRRQKSLRSFRFDRGYARSRFFFFFVPFDALPSYNDCIMTIAVSIFICGSAKSSRFALPVACTCSFIN